VRRNAAYPPIGDGVPQVRSTSTIRTPWRQDEPLYRLAGDLGDHLEALVEMDDGQPR